MKTLLLILGCAGLITAQPGLLLNESDFLRIQELTGREKWAADARSAIIRGVDGFPQSHLDRFGLKTLEVPAEGGQWTHWYVCPAHGVRLAYRAPNTHRCPIDNRTYSGWPYDQVIYSNRNDDLAAKARDLALAFRFTGKREYGEKAATILKLYADKYLTWRLHDKDNKTATSGARAYAQTLDESIWLIPMSWAYDLLSGTDLLTQDERVKIERDLLRACADTVLRYDAGVSNWQSWHNAGIAAVGFALKDQALISRAIDGKSGFRFQMKQSVVDEGFWYEGAWGYHFYALDALVQTAEMAGRNGVDLWGSEPALTSLFKAPLLLTFADGSLPAFNDSGTVNLFTLDRLYEAAWARTGDAALLAALGRRPRGRDALIWGAAELPVVEAAAVLESKVFPDSGYAVLRAPGSDHALMMKFGPHGGGHGHYDKLGFVSFANGGPQAVDPGTQPYAAPTHATWDLTTIAHNTLVLDEKQQAAATGKLLWFQTGDQFAAASADAGPAYANAKLTRTLFITPEYAVDLAEARTNDNAEHVIDWAYHNYGSVSADGLAMAPWSGFGKTNGYQHLTGNKAAETGDLWQATFDGTPRSPVNYGGTYASVSGIQVKYEVSSEQSYSGRFSGRITYTFGANGYFLCSTPVLTGAPKAMPVSLSAWVMGDGSGNKLSLRINDASDERWVVVVGPVNWTGWRRVEVSGLEKWTHYLGDDNGVFDAPARTIHVDLGSVSGAPPSGVLYIDDITLTFADGSTYLAADFEVPYRSLRVTMLPEAGTTVVTGEGLGPDLTKPVPYVLARRKAGSARFVALLEPFGNAAVVSRFSEPEAGVLVVESAGWKDTIRLSADGVTYVREMIGQ